MGSKLIVKLKKKIYLNDILNIPKYNKISFNKITSSENPLDHSLIFLKKDIDLKIKKKTKVSIISNNILKSKDKNYIYTQHPRLLFCKILKKLKNKNLIIYPKIKNNISKTSKISSKAIIGENVQIGNNTIVEEGAIIKSNTIIGKNCIIKSGSIIGGDGFSFERENSKIYEMIAFGGVKIGDNVSVGLNSTICKSTFNFTEIGNGSQIDTLVQIAHNVKIGKNCTITGGTQIGGSSIIGNNVWLSPCSNISNNIKIGDKSFIGIGSVVIRNVQKNSKVFGNPARKID
tara:strand:+ start:225 stop:1088 length:864 start_codon:yes stop_codon:yes gene_type:complete